MQGPIIDQSFTNSDSKCNGFEKPGHASLLGSKRNFPRETKSINPRSRNTGVADESWVDVLVAGIEFAQMPLESVDLVEREVAFAERLNAIS